MNAGKPDVAGLTQRLQELGLRIDEGHARLGEGDHRGAYEVFRDVWRDVQGELEASGAELDRMSIAVRLGIIAPLVGLLENLGATAISQGVLVESAASLRDALAVLGPADDPATAAKRSELLGCLGNTESARGQWEEAESAFKEALGLLGASDDPMTALERATYHLGIGEAAFGQGRFDDAAREFRRALDLFPALADVDWWRRRFPGDDPRLTITREASAARQWPLAVRAAGRLADCDKARGDVDEFLRRLDEAISLASAHGLADLERANRQRREEFLRSTAAP